MKNKKVILGIGIGLIIIGILLITLSRPSVLKDISKVDHITIEYSSNKETVDNSLINEFKNIKRYKMIRNMFISNGENATGMQEYVLKFYDKNDIEVCHMQYYPENNKTIKILIINDNKVYNYIILDKKLIAHLTKLAQNVTHYTY